jgi:formylglycine-generating enzyme required for sulfatase activity
MAQPGSQLSRRTILQLAAIAASGVALAPLAATRAAAASAPAESATADYTLTLDKIQIVGPDQPSDDVAWLAAMRQWRAQKRAAIGYDDANYRRPELAWAQRNPVQPQMMVHDLAFYDRSSGRYTVDEYLAGLERRYGGIDSVLIWPTYPNIGVDDRNTDQMFRDMPGGVDGLRRMIADFHRAGVKVLFPAHPWDVGTRDPGAPWATVLPATMAEIGADGLNGDTMDDITADYFAAAVADGNPLVFEPELGFIRTDLSPVQWNVQSWGEIWNYTAYVPEVSQAKWLEPRHTVHVNDRWSTSKIDMLQSAFFNGTGVESWENVWGIWNQLTDRDEEAIRRVAAIERELPDLLVSQGWEPHTPTIQHGSVFASKWPGSGSQTLWTLVNRSTSDTTGDQLAVPYEAGLRYYDLWQGVELQPTVTDGTATLAFPIEAKGFGAVLASTPAALPGGFTSFLREMRRAAQRPLSSYSAANTVVAQTMTPIRSTARPAQTPPGMVAIPGADFAFIASGTEIEGGDTAGVDVQYPWETQPGRNHDHVVAIRPFYIDRTEVTNAQYQQFMDAAGYQPADSHNFLKDWDWSNPRHPHYRPGWADKPVTWVSLEDARAYMAWAGKRLPNEWEWQYAAQGLDGRLYPWGSTFDAGRVPATSSARGGMPAPADVTANPSGASPFGVLDLVGNVWQWTNEYTDPHTAAAVVRGGSYYRPQGAEWYFPSDENAYRLDRHNKYLLMAPSLDRSAAIGFRAVMDAPDSASAKQ